MGGACTATWAQTVVYAEYFFDQDPGHGKGQNLSITSGPSVEINTDIPTTGLAPGTHTLFVRLKDSEGRWSLMEGRLVFIDQEQSVTSPNLTQAEYFFDTDPGQGKGKSLPLTAGGQVNLNTGLPMDNLSPGVHTLFVRFKDSEGRWSLMEGRLFHIQDHVGILPQLVRIEYFFDEANPERGKATPLVFAPGSIVELDDKIDISGLSKGSHQLNLRAQDQLGNWSTLEIQEFTITEPRVDTITPASGGNIGDVTVNILGASFGEGTKVKFVSNGKPDIVVPDSLMSIFNGEQIQAIVDLRGKAIGEYNVVVTLNSGQELTIPNGFRVIEGVAAHPWAEVIGFDRIRRGQWQTYTLVYGNKGNVDAHGVPVWFAVSDTAEIKFDFEFEHPYESFNVPFDAMYDSIPDYIIADTIMGYIGKKKLVGIYIPSIAGNSTKTLSFKVKINSFDPIEIIAWADEPLFGSPLKGWVSECMNDVIDLVIDHEPSGVVNCLNKAFNIGYEMGNVINGANKQNSTGSAIGHYFAGTFLKMPAVITSNLLDCALGPVKFLDKANIARKMLIKIVSEKTTGNSGIPQYDLLTHCLPPPEIPKPPRKITPVASFDPNDKLGLEGAGEKKYISGNELFPYLIRFENKASATAAAQTVLIIDTLDKEKLDLASLQLGFMSFNDRIINVPPGRKNYTAYIDLRPTQDLIVKIEAKLDENTGVLTWLYSSLDPATRKLTENPDAGFLPPNKTAPEGEGGVFFTIRPKNDLITNADIKNKAYIYFDNNEVIPTPTWSNAIDKLPPISQVVTLPQTQADSTFTVSWGGSDEGAGIENYSIYVSVNNQPYVLWLNKTTATSYEFEGRPDSTYQFYSIAQDSTGIMEAAPATADAITTIAKVTGLEDELAKGVKVYPNPAVHSFTVELPAALRKSTLILMNAQGEIVRRTESNNQMEVHVKAGQFAKGLYLLQISDGKSIVIKKVMIQ
jgi:hypothetical protein